MNENKHTPEPWRTDEECGFPQDIHDSKGNLFLRCGSDFDNEIYGEANARRIVACVNACAGIDTELLETAPVGFFNSTYGHPKYLEEITQQRDELLAENKQLRKDAERYRVLRDSEYQLDEDDPSVSDSFFNQYFGEELDAAVDELKSRFDSTIASVKEKSDGH